MEMHNNYLENRVIRVFISSTFRDMQDERDELMKKTFPMLRRKAAERDVTLTELDLRWGITPEESESGKVVEICLREIENSVPFFIGIIGNRYGWVPSLDDLGESLQERYSQVGGYVERHLSVTEMEMQFGVLERPEDMHAYFFIKEQEADDVDDPEKLAALKDAVRSNGRYPVSTYSSPEDLAGQVEEAFTKMLDELFPEGALTELEKERIGQRAYLNSLCQNYIRTDLNFATIDEWMADWEKHQLVITGASGLGKSALVANWVKEKLAADVPYKIIYHFVGNGGSVGSHGHVVNVLCEEIRNRFGFDADGKDFTSDEKALEELFNKVAAEGDMPLLIVLDAINQIIDIENSKQLNWLPIPPKNVKILFTTLEDDTTMEVFKNRKYPVFTLQPLTKSQREEMVNGYLGLFSKKLQPYQVDRIVSDKQCENTLVLKTLLDELVNFGIFEKLDEKIESYLGSESVEDFYGILLRGYESDFGEMFVKHILSLIAVSRNGLSEEEELSITKETPLHWSQFFCSIRQHLVVKNGLITFAHGYIRNAVEGRYLHGEFERSCREEIVSLQKEGSHPRAWSELAFQYDRMANLGSLYELLLDFKVFEHFNSTSKNELGQYWKSITSADRSHTVLDYLKCESDEKARRLNDVAVWCLKVLSEMDSTEILAGEALRLAEETGNEQSVGDACSYLGYVCTIKGKYRDAITFYERDLQIEEKLHGRVYKDVANSLDNLGRVWMVLGDYAMAYEYTMESLNIFNSLHEWDHVAIIENNLATLFERKGDYEKAINFYQRAISTNIDLFGEKHREVGVCYSNLCHVYNAKGDYNLSIEYGLKALEIARFNFGEIHLDTSIAYNNLAVSYQEAGFLHKALACYESALETRRDLLGMDNPLTATTYHNLGVLYDELGEHEKGMHYVLTALDIRSRILGDNDADTANSFATAGAFYADKQMHQKALDMYEQALRILYALNGVDNEELANVCFNMGSTYLDLSETDKAITCIQESLEIRKRLFGYKNKYTILSLNSLAYAYEGLDMNKSVELYQQALSCQLETYGEKAELSRTLFDNLQYCYGVMNDNDNRLKCALKAYEINNELEIQGGNYAYRVAECYNQLGRYGESVPYYEEAILEYTFGDDEYYRCLYELASAEEKIGNHDKAIELYQNAISEAGKNSDPHQLARSYEELGFFHLNHGAELQSLDAFDHAMGICPDYGGVPEMHRISSVLLRNLERYDEAIARNNEAMELFRLSSNERKLSQCYLTQGLTYRAMQEKEKARDWISKSLDLRKRIMTSGDSSILECERYLEELDHIGHS